MIDRDRLKHTFVGAALAAGKHIEQIRSRGFDIAIKADASPVTEADRQAEEIVLAALAKSFPDIPVVGEEATSDGVVVPPSDTLFFVDPLDGTKEFVAGRDEFTVNIALVENRRPTFGVVYAPPLDLLYVGDTATGMAERFAQASSTGGAERIATAVPRTDALRALASRSHSNPQTEAFLAGLGLQSRSSAGSSLKFCRIAEGSADIHPRFGPTNEWDTAAAHAVLSAAGGALVTLAGDDLLYNKRGRSGLPDFRNPDYVALGDRGLTKLFAEQASALQTDGKIQ